MDVRQQRGALLATKARIFFDGKQWVVPSENTPLKVYLVDLKKGSCNCEDFNEWGLRCKHLHAASLVDQGLVKPGEGFATEPEKIPKPTYKQDWAAYNRAQGTEKNRFMRFLYELCKPLEHSDERRLGRPRVRLSDGIFTVAFKVYTKASSRRFQCDLEHAYDLSYVSQVMSHASITNYMDWKPLTPVLQHLIRESARPLGALETIVAIDSTGFSSHRWMKWHDAKYGRLHKNRYWAKAHAAVGTLTNAVFAVEIEGPNSGDSPNFIPLLERVKQIASPTKVVADAAYISLDNLQAVLDLGATPYIPFRSNQHPTRGGIWDKLFHYYTLNNDDFRKHYHARSNVESSFSAIKRLFDTNVLSRNQTAIVNEVLCKVLCYNLTCINHSHETFGVNPKFWGEESKAG